MTTVILCAILVLVGIAIWQITKIFELSQLRQDRDASQIANDKDNNWNGRLKIACLVSINLIEIDYFWG